MDSPREKGAVMVTSHSSYLDGLVLAAVLPHLVTFVAKQELGSQVVAGVFLRRLGVLFVAHTETAGGLENIDQASTQIRDGRTLVFFPEGTLTRMSGLLPFRLGAFVVATRTNAKVVPVTSKGTRSVLREGALFPRRGNLSVTIGQPLTPDGSDFDAAIGLRDAARAEILMTCGKPDLSDEQVIFTENGIERVSLGIGN